jgi:hypothetical protein
MAKRTYKFETAKRHEAATRLIVNAAASAASAADKALVAARRGTQAEKEAADNPRVKWFGDFTATVKGRLDDLQAKIHKIVVIFDISPFTITYGGVNGGENALATHYAVAQPGFAAYGRGMAAFNDLTLRERFYALPRSSTTKQSQIETVIHELAHIAFSAADETLPVTHPTAAGAKAYEAPHSLWLAKNSPDQAFNNAENFGFFVMEFYKSS